MPLQTLDQLQARIESVLDLVKRLKDEKERLLSQNQQLELQLQEARQTSEQLSAAHGRLQELEQENTALRGKQEDIRVKVDTMLAKLDGIQ